MRPKWKLSSGNSFLDYAFRWDSFFSDIQGSVMRFSTNISSAHYFVLVDEGPWDHLNFSYFRFHMGFHVERNLD